MAKSRARDLAKEAAWRRRVARHAGSGQSVRAWCRRHRVKEAAFHWWRRELARRDAEASAISFVPVQITKESVLGRDQQIEIVLTNGQRVRVSGTVSPSCVISPVAIRLMFGARNVPGVDQSQTRYAEGGELHGDAPSSAAQANDRGRLDVPRQAFGPRRPLPSYHG